MTKHTIFRLLTILFLPALCIACGPKKPTVAELRAQKRANDSISYLQQCQSLRYYDSLLTATLPTIDPMLRAFRYEHNTDYEDHGHYVHRLLTTSSNTSRNYLQVYVRDDHQAIVRAYYYGTYPLRLQSLELSADSVINTFSGHTHSFEAEGYHETLTLEGQDALDALAFINSYASSRIRVCLRGEKSPYRFYISDNDKQAILETYQLATTMHDIHELEKIVRQTSLQVEKYRKRLEKQQ